MTHPRQTIAILGATSHIATGLIHHFLAGSAAQLTLFARDPARCGRRLHALLPPHLTDRLPAAQHLDAFAAGNFDAVINCIGAVDRDWLAVTAWADTLILEWLERHPEAMYLNFSSGAIYGRIDPPADGFGRDSRLTLPVNPPESADYYAIARLHSEARHRALPQLNIVDLRIFSYYSRYIDPARNFFMAELLRCLLRGETLATHPDDMIRDFVDPADLFRLVELCLALPRGNRAYDVYSAAPVRKSEILARFATEFGLRYAVRERDAAAPESPHGRKDAYFSQYHAAAALGYAPRCTSLESLIRETAARMEMNHD